MIKNIKNNKYILILFVILIVILIYFTYIIYIFSDKGLYVYSDVTFQNNSDENITITPVGVNQINNKFGPLKTIKGNNYFGEDKNTKFILKMNDSITISFNSEDQNILFVIIEFPGDDIRIMKIDHIFWINKSYNSVFLQPRNDLYNISQREMLTLCPEKLYQTISGQYITFDKDLNSILRNL